MSAVIESSYSTIDKANFEEIFRAYVVFDFAIREKILNNSRKLPKKGKRGFATSSKTLKCGLIIGE